MKKLNLNDYLAPEHESGLYKGIPMEFRNHPTVQSLMKTRMFTVRYRGNSKPNYNRPRDFVHKDYADTFAIYPYSNYPEYTALRKKYYEKYGLGLYKKLAERIENVAKLIVG